MTAYRWVQTGQVLTTRSGRQTQPVPQISLGTHRKTLSSLRRLDAWLYHEALIEASEFEKHFLRGMRPEALVDGDRVTLNDILWDGGPPRGKPS